jgi:hypothetical protein
MTKFISWFIYALRRQATLIILLSYITFYISSLIPPIWRRKWRQHFEDKRNVPAIWRLRDKCDVIFGTLSHNICRVIFWNFGMTSASICRINICRITFIVKNMILVKRCNTSSNRITFFRDKCDVTFGTFVAWSFGILGWRQQSV